MDEDMEGKEKRGAGECHELPDLSETWQTVKTVHRNIDDKVFCYLYCVLFDDVLIRRREKAFSLVTHECPASIKMFYVSTVICISVRLALHCVSSCRMLMTLSALLAMKVT